MEVEKLRRRVVAYLPLRKNGGKNVAILLAPGFLEGDTIYCLDRLRGAGISVSIVGLASGLITGAHGLSVKPDSTLNQLQSGSLFEMVLIPGGPQCTAALLADPRVHEMFDCTWQSKGRVAVLIDAEPEMKRAGLLDTSERWLPQGTRQIDAFTNELINLLII